MSVFATNAEDQRQQAECEILTVIPGHQWHRVGVGQRARASHEARPEKGKKL